MKKMIALICALVMPISAAACGDPAGEDADSDFEKTVVLADFEEWAPDFQLLRQMNNFGAIDVNEDARYVKDGTRSALVRPLGGYSKMTTPYFYIPTESSLFGYNYVDFNVVQSFTADVYNAESSDVAMEAGVITMIADYESADLAGASEFILKPGWNEVEYIVDRSLLNIANDISDIAGIYYSFENAGSRYLEDAPELYFDNIVLHRSRDLSPVENLITLDENEICGFEKLYQRYIITAEADNSKCMPDYEVVYANNYGMQASEGDYVLRLVTKPGDVFQGSWPKFTIPEKIMQASDLVSLCANGGTGVYIAFDVYAETDSMRFYADFHSEGGGNWSSWSLSSVKGAWVTFRLELSNLPEATLKSPGYMKISWDEYPPDMYGDMVFYFDNFRLETE